MDMGFSSNIIHQEVEVRKGPWTMEEDHVLINYIANHGEGVWNNLARAAGTLVVTFSFIMFVIFLLYYLMIENRR